MGGPIKKDLIRPTKAKTEGSKVSASFAALAGSKSAIRNQKGIVTGYRSRKSGERTIGGKTYMFRSLWEMNFAKYLDWLKAKGEIVDWFFEPKLFRFPRLKYETPPFQYLPDFKTVDARGAEKYYEVKGYMNTASQLKIDRLRESFPDVLLEVIAKPWFLEARRKKYHLLMKWEKL